jgi:rhodanese-related sulfurtransferase
MEKNMFRQLFGGTKHNIPSMNPKEAWKELSENKSAVLIDVREPWEYSGGHAKGAKNIPLSQLQQRVNEVPREREVLLICQSGSRSMHAAALLQQNDIPQVVNVTGGTTIWRLHGLPMENGKSKR